MPELPEVETIASDVRPLLTGRTIAAVRVFKADILKKVSRRSFEQRVTGQLVRAVGRRAKNLVLELDDEHRIVIQPGMTGGFLVDPAGRAKGGKGDKGGKGGKGGMGSPDPYDVIHFRLDSGRLARYRDVRRLGRVYLLTAAQWARHDAAIGPEPLNPAFTAERLLEILKRRKLMIKKAIMDQRSLAGVGNIYANEALWIAGIDPSKEARRVTAGEAGRLRQAIVDVLQRSIDGRGTTFRDYRTGTGEPGNFQGRLAVYERAGEPCLRCGRRIAVTHAIDARSSYFCPGCQH